MDKATPTLRQRCDTALQSLPDAPYRAMLAALFDEMQPPSPRSGPTTAITRSNLMKHHPTLPTFGAVVPGAGGVLGGIMRGELVAGTREPDYALIVPTVKLAEFRSTWGPRDVDVPGAMSLTDGWRNTAAMLQAKCAAAVKVRALVIDGLADWYIPSRAEMWALRANVPELFAKEWYWTSSQVDRYSAIAQHFAHGYSYWLAKDSEFRVRPVRKIQLQHFTA